MRMRSLLFVPGDRPERIQKAFASGADAVILDLEDAVVPGRKVEARSAVAAALAQPRSLGVGVFVRVNPLDSPFFAEDIALVAAHRPDAIVLPKAEGAASVRTLAEGHAKLPPILPIATETAAAVFELGTYREVASKLIGVTWGAEDLPSAIGAATSRDDQGALLPPYEMLRGLTLFAAHAAGVAAIETVYPDFSDLPGLEAYARRAARDGFTGMMAIHPKQVAVINMAFTPSDDDIEHAQAVVEAFAANPAAGALQFRGKMIDAPHLKRAHAILGRTGK